MDAGLTIVMAILLIISIYVLIQIFQAMSSGSSTSCYRTDKTSTALSSVKYKNYSNYSNTHLKDYYIKTAYNCCSVADNWVNECALRYTIKESCRCLDFEIYDTNGRPVIGTTLIKDGSVRDSYNFIEVKDAFNIINEMAFDESYTNCSEDPLIINFRIKSTNVDIYNKIAEHLDVILSARMMGVEHSYYNRDPTQNDDDDGYFANIANSFASFVTMDKLEGKIVLMISDCNVATLEKSLLRELVNILGSKARLAGGETCSSESLASSITSNSSYLIQLNNSHVVSGINQINDISQNIIDQGYLVIMIPDDNKNKNINYCYHKNQGINMIGMLFQIKIPNNYSNNSWLNLTHENKANLLDYEEVGNLNGYINWFEDNNCALILKTSDVHNNVPVGSCNNAFMWNNNIATIPTTNDEEEEKNKSYVDRISSSLSQYFSI